MVRGYLVILEKIQMTLGLEKKSALAADMHSANIYIEAKHSHKIHKCKKKKPKTCILFPVSQLPRRPVNKGTRRQV